MPLTNAVSASDIWASGAVAAAPSRWYKGNSDVRHFLVSHPETSVFYWWTLAAAFTFCTLSRWAAVENSGGNFLSDWGEFPLQWRRSQWGASEGLWSHGPGALQSGCCRHVYSRSCFCVNIVSAVLTESQTATVRYLFLILKVIRTEMRWSLSVDLNHVPRYEVSGAGRPHQPLQGLPVLCWAGGVSVCDLQRLGPVLAEGPRILDHREHHRNRDVK